MKERIYSIYASTISIIGFILQLTNINEYVKTILFIISVISLVILLIITIINNNVVKRKKLIKFGNNILLNAKEKVVLFGGDMSWVNDYIESIKKLNIENKTIEIFFPESKYNNCDSKEEFSDRIEYLKNAGAKVYSINKDFGLRCILLDPDTYNSNDNMEIMITDRISRHKNDNMKNKYAYRHLKYKNDTQRNICKSYISNYAYIKENYKEY